jgi:hypothetical protein
MKIVQRKLRKPLFIVMGLLTVLAGGFIAQPVGAVAQTFQVQYSNTAQATVQNITVEPDGNSINVQFDYDLRGTATSATVDAALNDQQSFGVTNVTGPGHFNQTLTDLPNGTDTIWIIISGNPDYELAVTGCGSSNQPFTVTLPSAATTTGGTTSGSGTTGSNNYGNNYGWSNYRTFTHYISFWNSRLIRY